jgi:hypothetical protein
VSAVERGPVGQVVDPRERVSAGCSPVTVRCAKCGLDYDEDAWADLLIERIIEPSELRRLVMNWPEGTRVEVRCCHGCDALISMKRRLPEAPHASEQGS